MVEPRGQKLGVGIDLGNSFQNIADDLVDLRPVDALEHAGKREPCAIFAKRMAYFGSGVLFPRRRWFSFENVLLDQHLTQPLSMRRRDTHVIRQRADGPSAIVYIVPGHFANCVANHFDP
jgi:hypothetical protein